MKLWFYPVVYLDKLGYKFCENWTMMKIKKIVNQRSNESPCFFLFDNGFDEITILLHFDILRILFAKNVPVIATVKRFSFSLDCITNSVKPKNKQSGLILHHLMTDLGVLFAFLLSISRNIHIKISSRWILRFLDVKEFQTRVLSWESSNRDT